MLKRTWRFIKDNIVAIITILTSVLTTIYATLRLCIYVYWRGYFTRLNIDASLMDLNFDNSIFAVIFIFIVMLVVVLFMFWSYKIINKINKKAEERYAEGVKKVLYKLSDMVKKIILSFIIMFLVNVYLTILIIPAIGMDRKIVNAMVVFSVLYITEMVLIIVQVKMKKQYKYEEKLKNRVIVFGIEILILSLAVLVGAFNDGNKAIDKKTQVQLVENEEYMISYCSSERFILHKIEYNAGEIVIHKNIQKIVDVTNCEISIKQVIKVKVVD